MLNFETDNMFRNFQFETGVDERSRQLSREMYW